MKKYVKIIIIVSLIFIGIGMVSNIFNKPKEELIETNSGFFSISEKDKEDVKKVRGWFETFKELGNPVTHDKDKSILRYVPLVFIGGGIYFVVQSVIRKKIHGSEEDFYRPYWKDENSDIFKEFTDEMGYTYGTSYPGNGMLGNRSFGDNNNGQNNNYNPEDGYYESPTSNIADNVESNQENINQEVNNIEPAQQNEYKENNLEENNNENPDTNINQQEEQYNQPDPLVGHHNPF